MRKPSYQSLFLSADVCFNPFSESKNILTRGALAVDNGERIGIDIFGDKMAKEYGAPYYHVHVSFSGVPISLFTYPEIDIRYPPARRYPQDFV